MHKHRHITTMEYNFELDLQRHFMDIKIPIYARIPIPKDRLAIFTSVTKEQALEETVLTSFHPVVHGYF